ncbi:MAG: hypothetical protein SGARI_002558, partial [Bacillariaceae sp.]
MSGGSVDGHVCNSDSQQRVWLPLFRNNKIIQQPVNLETVAELYAGEAARFISDSVSSEKPFFLYMAFSHVHQLCAPRDYPEQLTCQWSREKNSTFASAVAEMDWIAGQVLQEIDSHEALRNNTLVLFTSDNGPW